MKKNFYFNIDIIITSILFGIAYMLIFNLII